MAVHRTSLASGGLAYFVMLAIAPAAIVIGSIVGWFITPAQLQQVLGDLGRHSVVTFADGMNAALVSLVEHSSTTAFTITGSVSVLIAIYASSKMLYGLRLALDLAFAVPTEQRSWMQRVWATLATVIGLLAVVVLLLALAVVPAMLRALGLGELTLLAGVTAVDWLLLWVIAWGLVRVAYRYLNGAHPRLPLLAAGPLVAALAITLATAGVGAYAHLSSTLGAALAVFGSPVVVLLWLYLCFLSILVGAEWEGMRVDSRKSSITGSHKDARQDSGND